MYKHKQIEKKWQDFWGKNNTFKTENDFSKPKYYTLDMFPYPSGAGLHVGHPEGYTANDIVARYKHANGYNVLHPMGWDAFGLPAENYAIKTGTHPRTTTDQNIKNFKNQIKSLGFSYDWDREIDTTDPKYYKWTQWIFLKLFENGLAYEQDLPINYCPSCKTGLANEEVLNDFTCERCGTKVEKRKIKQWVLAITKYADRLLSDVDKLDWPESIKEMQRNWIGKSEGCEFEMKKLVENKNTNVLILHSYINSSGNLFPFLKKEIEDENIEVMMPDLFFYDKKPDLKEHINQLEKYKDKINENTIIIGHGLGYITALNFIQENNLKIKKFIGLDPIFSGINLHDVLEKTKQDFIDINSVIRYLENNIDYELINKNVSSFELYTSKDYSNSFLAEVNKHYLNKFSNTLLKDFGINTSYNFFVSLGLREASKDKSIRVYTTRIDTVFGMSYAVLAPDHKDVMEFITEENKKECLDYIEKSKQKSDQDRTADNKEKTGVFTGSYVINPYNNERVPLWIADYVLGSYGTGAVMAVPAHDDRDFEFANKYDLKYSKTIYTSQQKDEYLSYEKGYEEEKDICKGLANSYLDAMHYSEIDPMDAAMTEDGYVLQLDLKSSAEARKILIKRAEDNGFGTKKVNYKLRDWLFSRQRYWGEPIPLIHIELENLKKLPHITKIAEATDLKLAYILKREANKGESCDRVSCGCGHIRELVIGGKVVSKIYDGIYTKIICDYNLPLELPQVENYEPSGDGNSPLAKVTDFVNVKLAENLTGKRETNTMPQWGGSCWYYLRFMDPDNQNELVSPDVEKYWGQVDSYVGGAEHAVLHLLYARFWHKFLFDIGVVSHDEPFYRLRNQGLILSYAFQRKNGGLVANDEVEEKDGKFFEIKTGEELTQIVSKMSKSLKNVVNPDDIINEFGADSLRLYEMYMADFKDSAPWDSKNIVGVRRFLDRINSLYTGELEKIAENDEKSMKILHKTIKKVGEDIENYKFNTAIAQMMICINEGLPKDKTLQKEWKEKFIIILHPFAPHIAEELWQLLGNNESIFNSKWPKYDEKLVVDDTITIGVQVLGKLRGEIEIGVDEEQASVLEKARNNEGVKKWLEGKEIIKEIYVKGKIVNIVVK
nr:class I tRNA ligase family protein [Candidatus Gracilibacteria bacterium]